MLLSCCWKGVAPKPSLDASTCSWRFAFCLMQRPFSDQRPASTARIYKGSIISHGSLLRISVSGLAINIYSLINFLKYPDSLRKALYFWASKNLAHLSLFHALAKHASFLFHIPKSLCSLQELAFWPHKGSLNTTMSEFKGALLNLNSPSFVTHAVYFRLCRSTATW